MTDYGPGGYGRLIEIYKAGMPHGTQAVAKEYGWTSEQATHHISKALRMDHEEVMMTGATDDQLIDLYIQYRDGLEAMAKELAKKCEPYQEAMQKIEAAMMARLDQRQAQNSSTPAGVAYFQRHTKVKCEDKAAFIDWCMQYPDWGRNLLTANVAKEELQKLLDLTKTDEAPEGVPPAGVAIERFRKVHFKRG
jgi:hypothetical protein